MSKKKKQRVELRYYEVPRGENVLALLGDGWKQNYGNDVDFMHFHNLWEVGYCYYGAGNIELVDGSTTPYTGGTFTFIPVNLVHNTRTANTSSVDYWEFLFLDIDKLLEQMCLQDPIQARTLLQRISQRALVMHESTHRGVGRIVRTIIDEMREPREMRSELCRYYCYNLILEVARQNPLTQEQLQVQRGSAHQVKAALDYIDRHYAEQLRIEALAQCCGMSESYFRRLFEESVNMTPLAYINLVRIQHACEQLRHTENSVESIAQRVGFISQATFNRNFTRFVGTSPHRWKTDSKNYPVKLLSFNISAHEGWVK